MPPDAPAAALLERFWSIAPELRADLESFVSLLCQWQSTHNLVSRRSLDDVWTRHIADSLQLLAHAPDTFESWLDLGSGAGFPGFIVALACKPSLTRRFTLVEANLKKAAFLRSAIRQTAARADVVDQRIEGYADERPGCFDIVSARALAPVRDLCGLAVPFLEPGKSILLLLKGQDFGRELEEASKSWAFDVVITPSSTDPDGRILALRNLAQKGRHERPT